MSLVNQMLQDLDRRDAQDAPTYVMHNDGSTLAQKYRWAAIIRRSLWIFCTALACATLFVMWQQASRSPDNYYFVGAGGVLEGPAESPASTAPDNSEMPPEAPFGE